MGKRSDYVGKSQDVPKLCKFWQWGKQHREVHHGQIMQMSKYSGTAARTALWMESRKAEHQAIYGKQKLLVPAAGRLKVGTWPIKRSPYLYFIDGRTMVHFK